MSNIRASRPSAGKTTRRKRTTKKKKDALEREKTRRIKAEAELKAFKKLLEG